MCEISALFDTHINTETASDIIGVSCKAVYTDEQDNDVSQSPVRTRVQKGDAFAETLMQSIQPHRCT